MDSADREQMLIGFVLGIVFSVAVAAGGGYQVISSGSIPANADAKPAFEKWAAKTSLHATLAAEALRGPNPVAATDANLIEGVRLYGAHCAICHGTAKSISGESALARSEYPA